MTDLYSVSANTTILAADVNQYKSMLQGGSGYSTTWLMVSASGSNFIIRLGDAAGSNKLSVQNSASAEVWSVNSSGTVAGGSLSPTTLVLPQSASPAQTAEGSIAWDTDDDRLTVGTGAATKIIGLSRGAGSSATATTELVYDTTAATLKAWDGSTSQTVGGDPFPILADHFGSGGYKALGIVGGGVANTITGAQLATATLTGIPIGVGFVLELGSTSGSIANGTLGMSTLNTGTTSGQKATISQNAHDVASATANAADLRCTIQLDNNANRTIFFGIKPSDSASDENSLIGFRVTNNGNIFGVCDNAGTETTRDSGFAGNATPVVYRLRLTVNAGTVKFYVNDVQVGADVTTNVPALGSGTEFIVLGVVNSTTANAPLSFRDVFTETK